jgi:Cyclin, C-terminal domain
MVLNLSQYLCELALVNCKMLKFSNSNIAASSLYLTLKMTKHSSPWNEQIVKHSQYKESEIRPCAKELFMILQQDS